MPLSIVYNLSSTEVPALRLPSGLIDPNHADPDTQTVVHEQITAGETLTGLEKHNKSLIQAEAQARYGGAGNWGIVNGLGIKEKAATGLVGTIEIGHASMDGPI